MKILMLCSALWDNTLVRIYPFAKKISEEHEVTIAGLHNENKGIYGAFADLDYYKIRNASVVKALSDIKGLLNKDFDIIHCFKPRPGSYALGLALGTIKRNKVILDIDDIDFYAQNFLENFTIHGIVHNLHPLANKKTVANKMLQEIYGGTIIRTCVDIDFIKPKIKGSSEVKRKLGLGNNFVITFAGNPRHYKGMDIILEAIKMSGKKDIKLLYIGPTEDAVFKELYSKYRDIIKTIPIQPYTSMPTYLALTDLVVLPQRGNKLWSASQVPQKLYDGMAAGKPVIVSDVGDLPSTLGNAGLVAKDGNTKSFSDAIVKIYENPHMAKKFGRNGRSRCEKYFSWEVLKKETLKVYKEVMNS